jgi:drug/metabolite transporter (DMT)-like permease
MSTATQSAPGIHANEELKGILFLCGGATVFTFQDVIIKWISGDYPLPQVLTVRCVVAYVPLAILAHFDGGLRGLGLRRPGPLFLRGLLLLGSYTCYYLAIVAIPLTEAAALFYASPLYIVLLASLMLGERPRLGAWAAVIIGFVGVLIVLRPGNGVFQPASFFALASAVTYALAQVMARRLGSIERASVMSLYQNTAYLIGAGGLGLVAGNGAFAGSDDVSLDFLLRAWVWPDPFDFFLMAMTGVIAAFGMWMLTHAYRIAEVSVVAPFEYSSILILTIWGALLWGEVPGIHTILGVIVIVGAGIYVLRAGR